jgi:hypothetical protein
MLEVSYNLFKAKDGYKATVSISEDDEVLFEDEIDDIKGLRKNALIARKKSITLSGKVLTFSLNIINDKKLTKAQGKK